MVLIICIVGVPLSQLPASAASIGNSDAYYEGFVDLVDGRYIKG